MNEGLGVAGADRKCALSSTRCLGQTKAKQAGRQHAKERITDEAMR